MSERAKAAFDRAREDVARRLDAGEPGMTIAALHADAVDELLRVLFEEAVPQDLRRGVALTALGGYGRRELAPYSDLDLLLLHRGRSASDVEDLNRRLMYPLWDAGRELGNRVRDPKQVLQSFERLEEATAFLDLRFLAGDHALLADLEGSAIRTLQRARSGVFRKLRQANAERHAKFGQLGHLLEPDLRDASGGLRDIHTLGWAAKILGGDDLSALVAAGHLSELDRARLLEAQEFMLRTRLELHLLAGRRQDHLYLADQDELATRLGYEHGERGAGDALMQELYVLARDVEPIVAVTWERLTQRRGRFRRSSTEQLGDGCVLQEGRIEVVAVPSPQEDPSAWLRVFRRSLRHGAPVGRASLNRLQSALGEGPVHWTSDAARLFLEILQSGWDGVRVLEAMDTARLLSALLPEWEAVRCFPQRDVYHRFTVDTHLLAVVGELAASRPSDEPEVHDAWTHVDDSDVLFLAGLMHDIGKGKGGDHSVIGEDIGIDVATRMGLDAARASELGRLVRDHLVLAETATRRDINDERTIAEVVGRVGTIQRLSTLFLLTRADAISTGPEAWSAFRSTLIRELYRSVATALAGGRASAAGGSRFTSEELAEASGLPLDDVERLVAGMPEGWASVVDRASAAAQLTLVARRLATGEVRTAVRAVGDVDELIVVARDRPGLFAAITGALALRSIDVHAADIYTRSDGVAVDVFRVEGTHGPIPEDRWRRIEEDVTAALDGRLELDGALAKRSSQVRRRRAPRPVAGASRVVVDEHASQSYTVIEVHTRDRFGLLRTVARALYEAGCDIRIAKVATYGVEVVDVFYVTDRRGYAITDPDHIKAIDGSLHRALGERRSATTTSPERSSDER